MVEYEYVTCHDDFKYKMKNGTVIPKLVLYESSDEQETARAPSPLYEVEVINETADDLAMEIKEEEGQDDVQQTPPRRVIFEETLRSTPVRQRLGPTKSEIREAQRTKPAKGRLGSKLSQSTPKEQIGTTEIIRPEYEDKKDRSKGHQSGKDLAEDA